MAFEPITQGPTASLIEESNKFITEIKEAKQVFEENSAARGAVGKHISELSSQLANIKAALREVQNISMQVKMLSINASIEAARAGAAGKGFAVVANEIGKLSQNTDSAVVNIESSIGNMTQMLDVTIENMTKAKSIGAEFEDRLDACVNDAQALDSLINNTF